MKFIRRYGLLLIGLAFIGAGLIFIAYPPLASWLFEKNATVVVEEYNQESSLLSKNALEQIKQEAHKYNESLEIGTQRFLDYSDVNRDYDDLLDPLGTGYMGSIEIESIGVDLPIYHGTSTEVLAQGIGHVEGSSLPVGGTGTHCVLTGHCGVPTAALFTRLDELQEGDLVHLSILDENLYYRVQWLEVVDPSDLNSVEINPELDQLTLLTCTPYGVNSQRLLVHCIAVDWVVQQEEAEVLLEENPFSWLGLIWILIAGALMSAAWIVRKTGQKRQ